MGSCGQQGVDIQPSWRMVEGEREREREREEGYSEPANVLKSQGLGPIWVRRPERIEHTHGTHMY